MMTRYIALLRAVNVGGTGKLSMATLKSMCVDAGFSHVETYIASGNVIFESNDSSAEGGTIPRRSSSAQLLEATGLVPERKPTEPDPE